MDLKNKKVLLVGLGILGGGVATAKWLLAQGAVLTITDLKDAKHLALSLKKLGSLKKKIKFVLGGHEESDFLGNDIVVINPDVPADNKFVRLAEKAGKQIENELTLFYKFCPSKKIIAVTGTRGKTTTANWITHILKLHDANTLLVGNSPQNPLLGEIKKCNKNTNIITEAPSFLLEICDKSKFAPHIAVITNLYRDHINRHKTMEGYALAKGNIFIHQKAGDFLILDKKNKWTKFFIKQKPKSKVIFFSEIKLGVDKKEFAQKWGDHNLQNIFATYQAALVAGVPVSEVQEAVKTLPQIKFRQEKVFENKNLEIYNDTAATSPEALTASMKRFLSENKNTIFISGGTDRDLDFKGWAKAVAKILKPKNLILLSGSATEKIKKELGWSKFTEFDDLESCLKEAIERSKKYKKGKIIFSPGAKSFEKFKNEFDRGEKFNNLVKNIKKQHKIGIF